METGNIFEGIPSHIPDEIFLAIVDSGAVRIERIISGGQSTPEGEWYDQDRSEWVMVLKGSAEIIFEGERDAITLTAGDYVNIAAHRRHRVIRTDIDGPTVWLAVHYP